MVNTRSHKRQVDDNLGIKSGQRRLKQKNNRRKQQIQKKSKQGEVRCQSLEYKSLEDGGVRVKFETKWKGTTTRLLDDHEGTSTAAYEAISKDMSDALWELEQLGATPILPDGKVGGNAAAIFEIAGKQFMAVSRSGKECGHRMDPSFDVCIVSLFDPIKWYGEYYSKDQSIHATSDTPLHHSVLINNKGCDWPEYPGAALHGHALETEEEADKYGFPISKEETLFSTPEDLEALMALLQTYSYPEHKVYIRKGHGFFILGKDLKDAINTFRTLVKPAIEEKLEVYVRP